MNCRFAIDLMNCDARLEIGVAGIEETDEVGSCGLGIKRLFYMFGTEVSVSKMRESGFGLCIDC